MITTDFLIVSPLIVLALGAAAVLLTDVFSPGSRWRGVCLWGSLLGGLVAALATRDLALEHGTVLQGVLFSDPLSSFTTIFLLCSTVLCMLLLPSAAGNDGVESGGEVAALVFMAVLGAIVFASSAELITTFLGLEVMSLSLYCLCGSSLSRSKPLLERFSSESALKYFVLGSFSSAFLLFGIALLYGLTGSTMLTEVGARLAGADSPVVFLAVGLILVGVVFKLGGVPFHFWVPDVYQGAPTGIAAFMASVVKSAVVVAAIRILWIGLGQVVDVWVGALWTIAVVTIIGANVVAVRQDNVKRMLAYSSIAHAGYLMVGLLLPAEELNAGAAILFYIVGYTAMTLGAFAVVMVVERSSSPSGSVAAAHGNGDIAWFVGLSRRSPLLAAVFALFLLALAGLPPGMVGLTGKLFLFGATVQASYIGLAVVAVIGSAISCFYYLRVIAAMYFQPSPAVAGQLPDDVESPVGFATGLVLFACTVGVLWLGTFPSALYREAARVMAQL